MLCRRVGRAASVLAVATVCALASSALASSTPPTVTIGSPANSLLTKTTPITVSGTFGGSATVTVKVNGVTATKSGSSYSASVPLTEGLNTVTVAGIVTNALTNQPEPNVRIAVVGSTLTATSDASGSFTILSVPAGTETLHLKETGFQDGFYAFQANPGINGNPQIVQVSYPSQAGKASPLTIGTTATGNVRDLMAGSPVAGATITAGGRTATSAADGSFTLDGLPPTSALLIVATAPDHQSETLSAVVVPNGADPLNFQLRSATRGFISGTVVDAVTGQPVQGAIVGIAGSRRLMAGTNGFGAYTIAIVPPGTYSLEITQPSYTSTTILGVTVVDQQGTTANATIAHLPTTGAIQGKVTSRATGAAVVGAQITASSGQMTTSQDDGGYRLSAISGGMIGLSIHATGFPDSTRAVAVAPDADSNTPSVTAFDIELDTDTSSHEEASALITAASGGSISMLGGRLRVDIPPFALTDDATVDLRLADTPHSQSGQPLTLDPSLSAPPVTAVGPELSVQLESATPGSPPPKFIGPVVLTLRYPAADAVAAGSDEQSLFPFWYDGEQFTMLQAVPYFYGVDDVAKEVVAGLDFTSTESGTPVEVAATALGSPMLADANDPNSIPNAVRTFFIVLGSKLIAPFSTAGTALIIDLKDQIVSDEGTGETSAPVHANGLPLLVFHGWNERNILLANSLITDPMGDDRFGPMITDLLLATDGVYRPVFVTYNTRAPVAAAMNEVFRQLNGALGNGGAGGIQGEPFPGNPNAKPRFTVLDGFGYSKGALAQRELQCGSNFLDGMVSIAGPHHGALQNLENTLTGFGLWRGGLREFFAKVSPGTAELLDYDDNDPIEQAANPYLSALNSDSCSAPTTRISLIAGTDPDTKVSIVADAQLKIVVDQLIAHGVISPADRDDVQKIEDALSSGGFLVSSSEPSDGVVPVSSANAMTHSGDLIRAFDQLNPNSVEQATFRFSHDDVGKRQAPADQAQVRGMIPEVVASLTDWVVETALQPPSFVHPTLSSKGSYKLDLLLDYQDAGRTVSGVAAVVYGQDAQLNWHILDGADPSTLEPSTGFSISGNSKTIVNADEKTIHVELEIPEIAADKPETDIRKIVVVPVQLPITSGDGKVPSTPENLDFGVPGQ